MQCLENPELAKLEQISVFEENIIKGKSKTELSFFYSSLTRLHFLMGDFEEGVKTGENHEFYSEYDKGLMSHFDGKFFFALSLFYRFPQLPKSKHKFYLKKLKRLRLFIDKYAAWCPDNFKAYSLFIASEFSRLGNQHDSALALYEQTIKAALSSGLILIAAIASERAGIHCFDIKVDRLAKIYLHNAHRYFKDWGATTKVKLLEQAYPSIILDYNMSNYNASIASELHLPANTKNLDMLALLKFTQLISGEIRLDKLLQKLLVILLEITGAQRSVILTKANQQWLVEAEGTLDHQTIYLNGLAATELPVKYPISIVNNVEHTQKAITLNDAIQSDLTQQDAYVQQEKPKSILMMPLSHQGQLCRMFYIENYSDNYKFTASHLNSLQLLAAQAMNSLENATIFYQVTHDLLTGLANRNMLYELFQLTTKQVSRIQGTVALLYLDLDDFKLLNDSLGRDVGDKLLVHVAKVLTSNLREGDVAARVGGDEFTFMLTNVAVNTHLTSIVERLFNALSKPVQINDHLIHLSSSIGISVYPKDGNDIQTLLKLADSALHKAKEKGKNQFQFYSN